MILTKGLTLGCDDPGEGNDPDPATAKIVLANEGEASFAQVLTLECRNILIHNSNNHPLRDLQLEPHWLTNATCFWKQRRDVRLTDSGFNTFWNRFRLLSRILVIR